MSTQLSARKNILWIKADPLFPLDSGGKIRTYQMLKEWHAIHNITYLALFPAGMPESAKEHGKTYSSHQSWIPWRDRPKGSLGFYVDLLKNLFFSRSPYVIDKYRSAEATQEIGRLEQANSYDIVIADFLSMTPNIVAAGIKAGKTIVFQHNVESQIWKRHFESARNPLLKAYMRVQWKRYDRFERSTCAAFKGVIAVSEDDAVRFHDEFGLRNVLGHVPTGVDVGFFSELEYQPEPGHIVFLGSMDWMPNIDGIVEFVREVYPRIKSARPDVKLTIIGRNPTPVVLALQSQDPSIRVTGTVDDVRPYMCRAAVSIVPLRVGGGTRIKIFEAMAVGIPVVSSTIGAEGLPVQDGNNIFIADEPGLFAERVLTLLKDSAKSTAMGQAGKAMVSEKFSWGTAVRQFDQMCEQAISGR
jgi:glycosyltransferase involved in cell wall biosynthesis